jgi:hypothetical protein
MTRVRRRRRDGFPAEYIPSRKNQDAACPLRSPKTRDSLLATRGVRPRLTSAFRAFPFVRILVRIDYGNLRCPYLITANCIRTLQKSPIRVRRC